ncbi:MAG TPA: hypothetical protein VLQ90_08380, partial [Pyrinomonadaceae bacterium]|nr:hypothetical protein [Pyrinomonadaceae bacterium]
MNSKPSIRFFLATALSVGIALMFGANSGIPGNEAIAQKPQPTKPNNVPELSLVPLVILSVGLGNVSQPIGSPLGGPRPALEFLLPRFVPRGGSEFSVITSGGNVTVHFSDGVPAGVPASAFEWEQIEVPAGNAVGRLRYKGCSSCPASFTIDIGASSRESVHTAVKINLTTSTGRPALTSIAPDGDDADGQPRFEIKFEGTTFDPAD